jgi:penicillin-binding protein 2
MLVTPLQLANAYATFANGGTLYSPNVASQVRKGGSDQVIRTFGPRVQHTVDLPPTIRQPILDGLLGVTTQPGGTARAVFGGFPSDTWPVAAKTGTAEVTGKDDTAVFAAFGPVYDPQYVVVTMMEESGFGGVAAAPVVRRILEPLANPALMPTVGPGGVLSVPVITPPDPQSNGEVID